MKPATEPAQIKCNKTHVLSRVMRTVKRYYLTSRYRLLLNTPCSPDVFLRTLQITAISMSQTPQAPGASVATILAANPTPPPGSATTTTTPAASTTATVSAQQTDQRAAGPSAPSVSPSKASYQVSLPSFTARTVVSGFATIMAFRSIYMFLRPKSLGQVSYLCHPFSVGYTLGVNSVSYCVVSFSRLTMSHCTVFPWLHPLSHCAAFGFLVACSNAFAALA